MTQKLSEAYRDQEKSSRLNLLRNKLRLKPFLKLFIATTVVLAGSITLIGFGSQPALAASVSISDVSITTNDGTLEAVTISPDLNISWSGLDEPADEVSLLLHVSNNSGDKKGTYYLNESVLPGWTHGFVVFDYSENILNRSNYDFVDNSTIPTADEFNASDGSTNTKTVYLSINVNLQDDSNNVIISAEEQVSFTVTVSNEAANASTTGSVGTGASG